MTPMKAIRAKCMDCCAGQIVEVRLCPVTDCPLYVYRMGHRPPKDEGTAEAGEMPAGTPIIQKS